MTAAFRSIVWFELRSSLAHASTYVYFGIFFGLSFFVVNLLGGAWESMDSGSGYVSVNSPYTLALLSTAISFFGAVVTAALLGNAVYRDFEAGIDPFFFTTPISKSAYLGGRFTGALLLNAVISLSIPFGLMLASAMPYLDRPRFGAFQLLAFFNPYFVLILPNLIFTGAIFFSLAALTRQMMANYLGGILLVVGYLMASTFARDIESERLAAFLDPFGLNTLRYVTKYWTAVERTTQFPGTTGFLLCNRLLWVILGMTIFAATYSRFRFSHISAKQRRRRERKGQPETQTTATDPEKPRLEIAAPISRSFSIRGQLAQYGSLTLASFWSIVANRYFFAILGSGLIFVILATGQVGKIYGTKTWPVTYQVLDVLGGNFVVFILVVIAFYGGDLVWRERDSRTNQLQDAMPVPTWVPFAAKFTALTLMVIVLQTGILLTGVLTQAFKGYTRFELSLYLEWLFGIQLSDYILLIPLVLLIQVLVNHKYIGHLIVVLYAVFSAFMGKLGLEHNLYRYASDAGMTYSDMNRFGPYLAPFCWFKAYWAAWAVLFALLSKLFWVRGEERGVEWRVRLARSWLGGRQLAVGAATLVVIAGIGGFISITPMSGTNIGRSMTMNERPRSSSISTKSMKPAAATHRQRPPERGPLPGPADRVDRRRVSSG